MGAGEPFGPSCLCSEHFIDWAISSLLYIDAWNCVFKEISVVTTEKGTQEDHATVLPVSCLRDTVLSRHLIQAALAGASQSLPTAFPVPSPFFFFIYCTSLKLFIFSRYVCALDTHCMCGQDNFTSVFSLFRFWELNLGLQAWQRVLWPAVPSSRPLLAPLTFPHLKACPSGSCWIPLSLYLVGSHWVISFSILGYFQKISP